MLKKLSYNNNRPYLLLLCLLIISFTTQGKTIDLNNSNAVIDTLPHSQAYHDTKQKYSTIEKLVAAEPDYFPYQMKALDLIEVKTWVKLAFKNSSNKSQTRYLSLRFPTIKFLNAYWYDDKNTEQITHINARSAYHERPYSSPLLFIPITLGPGEVKTLYMHYQHFSNEPFDLKLYSQSSLNEYMHQQSLLNSLCLGFLFAIFFMVSIQGILSRNLANVYYSSLIISFMLLISDASGYSLKYLWPEGGWISEKSLFVIVSLIPLCHLLFIRQFLQLKYLHKKLNVALLLFVSANILLLLLVPFFNLLKFSFMLGTLVIPILIYTVIWSFNQKFPAVKVFGFSLLIHIFLVNLCTLSVTITGFYILPLEQLTLLKVAYLLEALFFAVAIALKQKALEKNTIELMQNQSIASQELIRLEDEVKFSTEKALLIHQQSLDKKQLLANVSHELRTPLTIMQMEVETLQYNFSDDIHASYNSLKGKITDINHLIDDLAFIATSDIGKLSFDIKEQNIKDIFIPLTQDLERYALAKGFAWSADLTLKDALFIHADTAKIRQLLLNIVNNSVTYTDAPGKIELSIKICSRKVIISVNDSAPNIEPEDIAKIFDYLFRVEGSRNRSTGGSGLGLSICKSIVDAHNGNIYANQSTLGGLSVIIELPLTCNSLKK